MEISVIRSSQVNLGRSCDAGLLSFSKNLGAKICNLKNNNSKACRFVQNQSLKWRSKSVVGFTRRASAAAQNADTVNSEKAPIISRTKHVSFLSLSRSRFCVKACFFLRISICCIWSDEKWKFLLCFLCVLSFVFS